MQRSPDFGSTFHCDRKQTESGTSASDIYFLTILSLLPLSSSISLVFIFSLSLSLSKRSAERKPKMRQIRFCLLLFSYSSLSELLAQKERKETLLACPIPVFLNRTNATLSLGINNWLQIGFTDISFLCLNEEMNTVPGTEGVNGINGDWKEGTLTLLRSCNLSRNFVWQLHLCPT